MYVSPREYYCFRTIEQQKIMIVQSSQELPIKDVIGDLGIWKWPPNLCESVLFQLERQGSAVSALHIAEHRLSIENQAAAYG